MAAAGTWGSPRSWMGAGSTSSIGIRTGRRRGKVGGRLRRPEPPASQASPRRSARGTCFRFARDPVVSRRGVEFDREPRDLLGHAEGDEDLETGLEAHSLQDDRGSCRGLGFRSGNPRSLAPRCPPCSQPSRARRTLPVLVEPVEVSPPLESGISDQVRLRVDLFRHLRLHHFSGNRHHVHTSARPRARAPSPSSREAFRRRSHPPL